MTDTEYTSQFRISYSKYEKIERKVVDLYVEQDIHTIPIDPFEIIKKRKYTLIPFSTLSDSVREIIGNENNDAFSFFDKQSNNYVIVYSDDKPLLRLRFTLMHEIGHIDLGHRSESDLAKRMADYYAGYALAPTPLIYQLIMRDSNDVSQAFWVSKSCAKVRYDRFIKWLMYSDGEFKDYENTLLSLFQKL